MLPDSFSCRFAEPVAVLYAILLGVLAAFAAVIVYGVAILPGGYEGASGLDIRFAGLAAFWLFGRYLARYPAARRFAHAVEALALFLLLTVFASLASAVLAIGGGPFIDSWLVEVDKVLFPFFDWKRLTLALPQWPAAFTLLSHVYGSLNLQPFVLIGALCLRKRPAELYAFVAAWGIGLAICILPFHWFPAQSPYIYYDLLPADLPGARVALPWQFYPVLEGMRSGEIDTLSFSVMSGLVTIPSFHACGAAILARAWWRFDYARWPMLALNAAMAAAAIPIGSHYAVDILAGLAAGLAAIGLAHQAERRGATKSIVPPHPDTAALPQPA